VTSKLSISQRSTGITALILCCAFRSANAEPVIGQFEIKTLESAPGTFEFQSQNAWSWGQPSRQIRSDDTGRLIFDDNAVTRQRHALELEAGLTSALKTRIGVEFESERFDEPNALEQANDFDDLQLTELGMELIAIVLPPREEGASLGVVAEFEHPLDQDESSKLILGPIVEFRSDRWFVAAVPTVVRTFGGDSGEGTESDDKWDFMYAAQLAYTLSERWSLALEGYGTVAELNSNRHSSESEQPFRDFNQHRAGVVFYYKHDFGNSSTIASSSSASMLSDSDNAEDDTSLTVGVGLLEGLNGDTPDHTLKLSIEIDF
jgi:hypothetical protein